MRATHLADASTLGPDRLRAGVNAVHAHIARLADALTREQRASAGVRRWTVASLVGLTLVINAMALAAPMVTLAVFDYVVRDGAYFTLATLCAIGGLGVVYELMLRRARAAMAADAGVRAAAWFSSTFFASLLQRDVRDVATEAVSSHVARFRALRILRRCLTGPVTGALLDAPFALVIGAALLVWFGPIGFVPLGAVAVYLVAAHLMRPYAVSTTQHGERAREQLRVALAESAAKRETLEELGMTHPWAQRIEGLAMETAVRREREAAAEAALDAIAHAVMALCVVATLWIGAGRVMDGAMTLGGVIAALMLVWRCVTPLETVFRATTQLRGAAGALRGMRAVRSRAFDRASHLPTPKLSGALSVRGIVVRNGPRDSMALRGVSFDIAPGEIVAVCGPAGSGKSTLLEAVLGLAHVESGVVSVDGRDVRGIDPTAFRTQTAYAPQRTTLFHGTVAQNIRLVAPAIDAAGMTEALARAGVRLPHPLLPDGVETRLMSGGAGQIDESLRAKIMLAGLYAKEARLYLLDDPGALLDRDGDVAFLHALSALRGKTTVILVTNRPSHMRACDRIIRLEHGMVMTDGATAQVLGG